LARRKNKGTIDEDQLMKINAKIYPYDLIILDNPEEYIFRKPAPYLGTCEYFIERGFGLQTYLKVKTEQEAVTEVKRLIKELGA
jgi:hypothetical protein